MGPKYNHKYPYKNEAEGDKTEEGEGRVPVESENGVMYL